MSSPATFGQPAGWAERATMLDEKAEHQIRIHAPGATYLYVSCTCRGGKAVIAEITTCEQAWTAYNGYHTEMI